MADITNLKESLSNFGELTKQFNAGQKKEQRKDPPTVDEEYIEEDFEEHVESDDENDSEEEKRQIEKLREEQ